MSKASWGVCYSKPQSEEHRRRKGHSTVLVGDSPKDGPKTRAWAQVFRWKVIQETSQKVEKGTRQRKGEKSLKDGSVSRLTLKAAGAQPARRPPRNGAHLRLSFQRMGTGHSCTGSCPCWVKAAHWDTLGTPGPCLPWGRSRETQPTVGAIVLGTAHCRWGLGRAPAASARAATSGCEAGPSRAAEPSDPRQVPLCLCLHSGQLGAPLCHVKQDVTQNSHPGCG